MSPEAIKMKELQLSGGVILGIWLRETGSWGPLTTTPAPLLWTKNHISPFSEELAVDLLGSTKMMVERQLQYS